MGYIILVIIILIIVYMINAYYKVSLEENENKEEDNIYSFKNNKPVHEYKKVKPDYIYKFYSLTNISLNGILNANNPELYFFNFREFPSNFEFNPNYWDFSNIGLDFFKFYYELKNGKIEESKEIDKNKFNIKKIFSGFKNKPNNQKLIELFEQEKQSNFKNIKKTIVDFYAKNWGLTSFSSTYKSNLLWNYYALNQGFCIEFDQILLVNYLKNKYPELSYFFPINYQQEFSKINIEKDVTYTEKNNYNNIDKYDLSLLFIYIFSVKQHDFEFENEWRILINNNNFYNTPEYDDFNISNNQNTNRNIKIEKEFIRKIIISDTFFNNKVFIKMNKNKNMIVYEFNKSYYMYNLVNKMLSVCKDLYNEKIYQIEKDENNENSFPQKSIKYKIKILDIDSNYLIIDRTNL